MATPEELAARRREELRRLMLGKGAPPPRTPAQPQPDNLTLGEQAERERAKRLYAERAAAQRAAAGGVSPNQPTPPDAEARRRAALEAKRRELARAKQELARREAEAARAQARRDAVRAQPAPPPAPPEEIHEAPEPISEPAKPAQRTDTPSKANRIATLLKGKGARDVMLLREVLDPPLALRDERR